MSYKAVLLEGLEVAFIVIAFGALGVDELLAGLGAAIAAGLIMILGGVALKQPLTQVPENNMKFVVGAMLTTFGTYWAAEGFGVEWGLGAATPLVIFGGLCLVSWLSLQLLRTMLPQGAHVNARHV